MLLYLIMLISAMFFGAEGSEERPAGMKIGPFKFTLGQVFISLMSLVIVTPVTLIVVNLFKRAKPKTKDLKATMETNDVKQETMHSKENLEKTGSIISTDEVTFETESSPKEKEVCYVCSF